MTRQTRPVPASLSTEMSYACAYTRTYILVGCKHWANEGVFYIRGRGFVCLIIEPVTFARCAFIFALRNIALGGYLDTRRNINFRTFTARRTDGLKYIY